MAAILLAHTFPHLRIERQLPSGSNHWAMFEYTTDPTHPDIFGCVVYDNLLASLVPPCPRSHCLLVTGEPPSLKSYRPRFTHLFGGVHTSHQSIQHPRKILDHEAQPWHYGLYPGETHGSQVDYEYLSALPLPTKTKLLSVIASNKTITEDHRQRLRFVEKLKEAFPGQIDVFGRGIRDIQDKSDAIFPYAYHVVLENDHSAYYMSEKITDPFLGWAFPFYSGGPRADALLPAGSFERIDMYDLQSSVQVIRKAIENQLAEKHRDKVLEARRRVLDDLNLFAILDQYFRTLPPHPTRYRSARLHPKGKTAKLMFESMKRKLGLA